MFNEGPLVSRIFQYKGRKMGQEIEEIEVPQQLEREFIAKGVRFFEEE